MLSSPVVLWYLRFLYCPVDSAGKGDTCIMSYSRWCEPGSHDNLSWGFLSLGALLSLGICVSGHLGNCPLGPFFWSSLKSMMYFV